MWIMLKPSRACGLLLIALKVHAVALLCEWPGAERPVCDQASRLSGRLPCVQVFPLEVVRRRMQTLAAAGLSRGSSMAAVRQAIMDIWAKERLGGFYAGMLPNTIQVLSRRLMGWQASEEHCCM